MAEGEETRLTAGVDRALVGAVRGSAAVVKELIDMKDSDGLRSLASDGGVCATGGVCVPPIEWFELLRDWIEEFELFGWWANLGRGGRKALPVSTLSSE